MPIRFVCKLSGVVVVIVCVCLWPHRRLGIAVINYYDKAFWPVVIIGLTAFFIWIATYLIRRARHKSFIKRISTELRTDIEKMQK